MRRKPPKKTTEEKVAEEYFPVDEDNLKNTTEKEVKESEPSLSHGIIEKEYKKQDRKDLQKIEVSEKKKAKKISRKKPKKKKTKEYPLPKINLKKEGYELIITEKPQAAMKIASALGKSVKRENQKVPYYEINKKSGKIVVACAVGHLFTLKQKNQGYNVPIFDISWVPNFIARKKDFTKRYYDTLLKLAKNARSLTVATDFDIEGEVIGLNIVRFICNQKDANRMKFSTLTEKEINKAYDEKASSIDWGQAIAGETRHYLDWFYGINFSRALMNAIKTTGKFRIMSIGRVQGPALNLIVKKEQEIQAFKPKPYWQIFITIEDIKNKLELKHNKDIFQKEELKKFENLNGKTGIAETKKTQQIIPPNPPFNLTTLQTEAYKFHGITPSNTLRAAQSLYLAGLISYPRTSSQKLPDSINYKEILDKLSKKYNVEKLITKKKPIEGGKTDPAHPSIHPTGEEQILSGDEEKIYNLIVKRFLSLFCDDAIIDNKKVSVKVEDLIFNARGTGINKKAWMEIYPIKLKENEIPDFNGEVKITDLKIEEKETKPPKRFSPASIVSELEKRNLGTKSTRSSILETLYDRGYIKEKSIEATSLGISLIDTLEKYSPIIIDEKLTRYFEKEMEKIQESKKDFKKKENKVIDEAKKTITKIAKQFNENEKKIGIELLNANIKLREKQKEENKLNLCPVCKKGNLAITYSKKTRRNFIACNAYPDCKTTYSLPPNGVIKKTDKICESCNFPMLMLLKKSRKPWFFCFNKECETNKKRLEEYRKRKGEIK
ncbi:MAG TPA: DNA topoisomerase I [Ignavibacteria bacterium]|nr:DNA topoisomerase I [Ignavibacteria bacterium]